MAVAMKDLEIRGAGNVLGAEQSGHVAGVGFDLYVRLVGEAVEAYRAAADGKTFPAVEEPKDVRIDLPVDKPAAGLHRERPAAPGGYRRLAAAAGDAAVDSVVDELVDRYGRCPNLRCDWSPWLLRLLLRYGITEVSAISESTLAVAIGVGRFTATSAQAVVPERALPRDDVDGASADTASGFWRWGTTDS